jgi:hypothetical protein
MLGISDIPVNWDDAGNWRFPKDIEPQDVEILYKKVENKPLEIGINTKAKIENEVE